MINKVELREDVFMIGGMSVNISVHYDMKL